MANTYKITGHGLRGVHISGTFSSKADAVARAKMNLGRGAVASTWPDGTVAIYASRGDLRRDDSGAHAAYCVETVRHAMDDSEGT